MLAKSQDFRHAPGKKMAEGNDMQNIRVMIVDDNEDLRRQLAAHLQTQPGISIVGEAGNGQDALKQIHEIHPDILLLDMIMPVLDGFGVLSRLQQLSADKRPKVIATTALGRDDFICRAVSLGVTYYMIKPIDLPALVDRIHDIADQVPLAPVSPLFPLPGITLDDKLSNIFLNIGIPAHIKGYQFLREAVKLVIAQPPMIGAITKELYPAIAHKFATSPSKVERAIRHAIEVAWNRGRVDTLNKAFGCNVAHPGEKPTNGEFIALLADKMSADITNRSA